MLAVIAQDEQGYTVRYVRHLKHPVEKVWAMLTENEKLSKWFSELSVDDLRVGGAIKFDLGDGNDKELEILELRTHEVLAYRWGGEDTVRFELYPEPAGCKLVLIEQVKQLTDHTPKDLAGWHVCLDVIEALLDGRTIERMDEWKLRYAEYEQALKPFKA
ncbi:SRPBCC family protein [Cohnella nanjingensis]|uniref:SRPBCC family protein n=1 Tax=Cohnella nanjingensis TaxID=1387779 RepID=A0A7X0VDY5_9BACL|nr:SRPBCC family protein [Cohnella nanjingensis]MBB6670435.1 SRPBCC family protein [Cohnella nanjingensis]